MTEPIAVALKFGFLAVLYLFCSGSPAAPCASSGAPRRPRRRRPASTPLAPADARRRPDAFLVAVRGGGLPPGERYDLFGGLSIGRSSEADVRIEDRFASAIHARLYSLEPPTTWRT